MVKMTLKEMYEIKKFSELNDLNEAKGAEKEELITNQLERISSIKGVNEIPVLKVTFEKLNTLIDSFREKVQNKLGGWDRLFGGIPGTNYRQMVDTFDEIDQFISGVDVAFTKTRDSLEKLEITPENKNKKISKLLGENLKKKRAVLREIKVLESRIKKRSKETKSPITKSLLKEAFLLLKENSEQESTKRKAIKVIDDIIKKIQSFNNDSELLEAIKSNNIPNIKLSGENIVLDFILKDVEDTEETESSSDVEDPSSPKLNNLVSILKGINLKITGVFEESEKDEFIKQLTNLTFEELERIISGTKASLDSAADAAGKMSDALNDNVEEDKRKSPNDVYGKILESALDRDDINDEQKNEIKSTLEGKDEKAVKRLAIKYGKDMFGDEFEKFINCFTQLRLLKKAKS